MQILKKEEKVMNTLDSPINIFRKLNKMGNFRDYGYDEKADNWSVNTIWYEMLIDKWAFNDKKWKI